jgi:hypothetical protein
MTTDISGGDGLLRYLEDLAERTGNGETLRVGFLESATYPDGTPVAAIALNNEVGNPANNQPPRPFFRKTIAENSHGWGALVTAGLQANDMDGTRALSLAGEVIVGQIQQSIRDFTDPGNADSTIKAKGYDAPLRHTKHMLNSVDYDVKDGAE